MTQLGNPPPGAGEIEVAPPVRALGWIVLLCSVPLLLIAVPSIIHLDPFVLAHAERHRVDGGGGHYPAGVLEAISLGLNVIWLFLVYLGVAAIATRQYFSEQGVRYRRLVWGRRLPLEAMTSITLTGRFHPRAADVLGNRTGIDLRRVTDASDAPGFHPLLIRGTVGGSALTKLDLKIQLQPGRGSREAMAYVERWVRTRPELVDEYARSYFEARGALPPSTRD